MTRSTLAAIALASSLAAAAPPAQAASPGCDQCSDLPMLYRELLEQEFLRNRFDRWIREAYYPVSVEAMQTAAVNALDAAMSGDLYGVLGAPRGSGGGGSGGGGAAPAYGTDMSTPACALVEYVTGRDGKQTQRPVTPDKVRAKLCKPLAEYTLVHEGHHQASCKAAWAAGGGRSLSTVEFFVQDDRDAYQAGIAVLRRHIAELARKCSWSGSTNARRPDGTMTVPTPAQIAELKNAAKAKSGLLKRASR